MYAKGMTAYNIEAPIQNIYGISASDSVVGQIADKYLPAAKKLQEQPLQVIYAAVFLHVIHHRVHKRREDRKEIVYTMTRSP